MDTAASYLWVGVGSALGGVGRFWLGGVVARRFGEAFPWGTLLVNVSGSVLIGFLAAWVAAEGRANPRWQPWVTQFLMIGLCGGYTTFSSFSLQTLQLLREGQVLDAALNGASSVVLCLAGVWLGFVAGQWVNR